MLFGCAKFILCFVTTVHLCVCRLLIIFGGAWNTLLFVDSILEFRWNIHQLLFVLANRAKKSFQFYFVMFFFLAIVALIKAPNGLDHIYVFVLCIVHLFNTIEWNNLVLNDFQGRCHICTIWVLLFYFLSKFIVAECHLTQLEQLTNVRSIVDAVPLKNINSKYTAQSKSYEKFGHFRNSSTHPMWIEFRNEWRAETFNTAKNLWNRIN